jgi:hypothetical protein
LVESMEPRDEQIREAMKSIVVMHKPIRFGRRLFDMAYGPEIPSQRHQRTFTFRIYGVGLSKTHLSRPARSCIRTSWTSTAAWNGVAKRWTILLAFLKCSGLSWKQH